MKAEGCIHAGIKSYSREQGILLRLMRDGPMSQDRFDDIFNDYRASIVTPKNASQFQNYEIGDTVREHKWRKLRFLNVTKKSFLLGDLSSLSEWPKWLGLLQYMVRCRLVLTTKDQSNGNIIYKVGIHSKCKECAP